MNKELLKPHVALSVFFFLFYRDVEGAEPAAQSERVYRPENYCWRQRVWSPPKCSSFLQLVFQGPGEKVCLRFPVHQLLIQSVSFHRAHLCRSFFFFFPSPSLSCRCVKTLVPNTGPAAIPSLPNECIFKKKTKKTQKVITFPPHVGRLHRIFILMSSENVPWLGMFRNKAKANDQTFDTLGGAPHKPHSFLNLPSYYMLLLMGLHFFSCNNNLYMC